MEHVDRETRIADLAIHGWVPVCISRAVPGNIPVFGVLLLAYRIGFVAWVDSNEVMTVGRINIVNFPHDSVCRECAWSDIPTEYLDAIERRLEQV